MKVGVIDYGASNIFSVVRALNSLGASTKIVKTPEDFETVTRNGRIFRRSKIDESPIWLVNIRMPRKFIEDTKEDIIQYSMSQAVGADDIPALEDTIEPQGDTGAIGQ